MIDPAAHREEVEAWREERHARLRNELGWLTLAGLDWLKEGPNRIGAAPDADVVLPTGPDIVGTITVDGTTAVADGAFGPGGARVDGLALVDDRDGEPTLLEVADLRLCVIERGGRLAVRTWDTVSPKRRDLGRIAHFPVDARWRIEGRFEPTPGRSLAIVDVVGTTEDEESPGDVAFEVDGQTHRIQALPGGPDGELFLIFGDETNGIETYGGGRYLYIPPPTADGTAIVDFNRAYNPPCVFTPYATCALPWPANRLALRIEAGELAYGSH